MTSIIAKRRSLHRNLASQKKLNNTLKFEVGQLQALANIGVTTCMIAHEINNLLTPLATYAELALNNADDKPLTEKALQKTARNCQRASKIMQSILAVANGQNEEKQNSPLGEMVEEIFTCLCRDFSKDQIRVEIEIPEDLEVWAVPVQIQQVLMNMILNARDAMIQGGGVLNIKAQDAGNSIQIKISDTGRGIARADLARIFDPFFTTKNRVDQSATQTSGSGLGLAFCKKIVESHIGSIKVESGSCQGTTFKIVLPKSQ